MNRSTLCLLMLCWSGSAFADDRPEFKPQRWQEDWRALCDPAKQTQFLDPLKCMPLGVPGLTVTFGGEQRERFDSTWNPTFGFDGVGNEHVLLSRTLLHADVRYQDTARAFVQLGSHFATDRAFGNPPTDRDDLDLQQGFFDLSGKLSNDTRLTVRAGRQEISFGSSRLVSTRESPNIRRSFDGARAFLTGDGFRLDALAVRPLELREDVFDDRADDTTALWGVYGTLFAGLPKGHSLDVYYFGFDREGSRFAAGTADENRHSFGTRYAGVHGAWDWDLEAVLQVGSFGSSDIRAWTAASSFGYTFADLAWSQRLGLKANIASGDSDLDDGKLETFNAMFPKLPYFTEANVIAPANFIDVHPTLTLSPTKTLELTLGWNVLWKQEDADAFYAPPLVAVNDTIDTGRFIGHQASFGASYDLNPNTTIGGSYVHFFAGDGLRAAGGRDGDFVGAWTTLRF